MTAERTEIRWVHRSAGSTPTADRSEHRSAGLIATADRSGHRSAGLIAMADHSGYRSAGLTPREMSKQCHLATMRDRRMALTTPMACYWESRRGSATGMAERRELTREHRWAHRRADSETTTVMTILNNIQDIKKYNMFVQRSDADARNSLPRCVLYPFCRDVSLFSSFLRRTEAPKSKDYFILLRITGASLGIGGTALVYE